MATGGSDPAKVVVVSEGDQEEVTEQADPTLADSMKKVQCVVSISILPDEMCANLIFM